MAKYLSSQLSGHFFYAVDVLGCIDFSEYDALHKTKQETIQLILSAGHVDLELGSKFRVKLETYFPPNTKTGIALAALIASHVQPWVGEQT